MTISSSLNAGVMGLAVNSTRLGTIADNIANSDTIGYKRSAAEFQSMVVRSQPNAYSAGGVRVDINKQVQDEGALISTGSATDLAISGRGMLPVTDEAGADIQNTDRALMMVPTGSFNPDANGYLRTSSGLFLLGFPADSLGNIGVVSRQSSESLEPVRITTANYTSSPTQNMVLGVNLDADETVAGATGGVRTVQTEYYDNLGRTQVLDVHFTPQVPASGASNQWNVEIFDDSGNSLSTFDVEFADTPVSGGSIVAVTNNGTYDSASGEISLTVPNGSIQMYVGRPGRSDGLTQLAAPFSPSNLSKDGAAIGNLVSTEVDSFGRVQAVYDTGFRQILYQVPVVDVPNLNGLEALDAQAFRVSQASGDLYLHDANSQTAGEMVGNSLMESTVDIASELTQLIETQRAYTSNAKIIQTVDEMLRETTNIIR